MKSYCRLLLAGLLTLFFFTQIGYSQSTAKRLTLIHTNDIQSRLLGFAPNPDYTPLTLNDDKTVGSIARMATVIRKRRAKAPERTLVLDGGDFMMGTLFQTLGEDSGAELQLMHAIGYDAAVLGNHEFDFRSDGLSRIIRAAHEANAIPPLLLSNISFSKEDKRDDALESVFTDSIVQSHMVIERNGIRIGLFGLMGIDAAEVSPYAAPVIFEDPIENAKKMVALLKEEEKVDMIICLSHGGVHRANEDEEWGGEDVELARAVPGIDVIIGGHSHTPVFEPIIVDGRIVVQAGSEAQYVGVIEMEIDSSGNKMINYDLIGINDSIPVAMDIHEQVEGYKKVIDQKVLAQYDIQFDSVIVETTFDLSRSKNGRIEESNMGVFCADAIRWGANHYGGGGKTDMGLTSAGLLRDNILVGERGFQQASDIFRVLPLGIGSVDSSPGYPLSRVYLTNQEIKSALEIMELAYQMKGGGYFPYFSGIRFRYNPNRVPFDRVYEIELGDTLTGYKLLDLSYENTKLYSVAMNAYILANMSIVDELSYGMLEIIPKDKNGKPYSNLDEALIDADPNKEGIQEVKEWAALLGFAKQFPDINGNGIPDIPKRYEEAEIRMIPNPSWYPSDLMHNATAIQWGANVAFIVLCIIFLIAGRMIYKKFKRNIG